MSTTMEAVVKAKAAPGIELREVSVPVPGPGEVLVRVLAASVWRHRPAYFQLGPVGAGADQAAADPGHEFSGAVAGWALA